MAYRVIETTEGASGKVRRTQNTYGTADEANEARAAGRRMAGRGDTRTSRVVETKKR
ncbi:MAG: hypothetical protein ABW046_20700 [Actinoplanes sp.]